MKILVNAVSAKSGGAATYITNLFRAIAATGSHNRYVVFVPSRLAQGLPSLTPTVTVVATGIGYKSAWQRFIWDQFTLRLLARREKADLLLSTSDFGMFFPPCKQILMIRNHLFFSPLYAEKILPGKGARFRVDFLLRRFLVNLSAKSSDAVVTASQSMLRDVRRFISIPNGKAVVSYFGVPLENFNNEKLNGRTHDNARAAGIQEGSIQLLYVSEYSDYKNLSILLKAVLVLRQRGINNFRLVSTADPSQFPDVEVSTRILDSEIADHPLVRSHIKFIGSIPYEEIPRLYAESDIFVFPSLAESFGHPLVEAMASGLPIAASDIPICREICGDAAEYFNPSNPTDLADAISRLKNDRGLRDRLGRLGRKRAEDIFDWRNHVRRLIAHMETIATGAKR